VALNSNENDHHVIRYSRHIVESGVKHQYQLFYTEEDQNPIPDEFFSEGVLITSD
jgi:hypothetical protein